MLPLVYHASHCQLASPHNHEFPVSKYQYLQNQLLSKVRTSPRTALAYEQKRVRGIQIKEGWLPFKAQYQSNRIYYMKAK